MGETAENVATKWGVGRAEQDAFALESHRRAAAAWAAGDVRGPRSCPCPSPQKKGEIRAVRARRVGARRRHAGGAGASSSRCSAAGRDRDGGQLVAAQRRRGGAPARLDAEAVEAAGLKPLARVVASQTAGVEPNLMGEGPIPAVRRLLERAGQARRRPRSRGAQRGVRRAGARLHRAASSSTRPGSTCGAEPSPSATPSAARAPASPARWSTPCARGARGRASRRSASASARGLRRSSRRA